MGVAGDAKPSGRDARAISPVEVAGPTCSLRAGRDERPLRLEVVLDGELQSQRGFEAGAGLRFHHPGS